MKRYTALIAALALILTFALTGCGKGGDSTETTASTTAEKSLTCSLAYPVLDEDGYVVPTGGGMRDFPGVQTLEDALKDGLGAGLEVTFDSEGYIASIGQLKAENGNKFTFITVASNGHPSIIETKPSQTILEEYGSYELIYTDENGEQITRIE